ncbi:hypothetical protein I7I48_08510 [Histoplasma ohiense]|nr:hypothetical protein I7I48_08510 [Histoplasma ohiense (nom. inval.)]
MSSMSNSSTYTTLMCCPFLWLRIRSLNPLSSHFSHFFSMLYAIYSFLNIQNIFLNYICTTSFALSLLLLIGSS